MDPLAEIKRLYYQTRPATIRQDFARAIELLKSMASEEERERATAYMDGLSQMRSEWAAHTHKGPSAANRRQRPSRRKPGR